MEKEYVNPEEGKIKEDEEILWFDRSNHIVQVIYIFLLSLPIMAFILVFSYKDLGFYTWVILGLYLLAMVILGIVSSSKNSKLIEEYYMTTKKLVLNKKTEKLVYWFGYDEILDVRIKRNFIDLLFKTATLRLQVIHTTHNRKTLEVVSRSEGLIDMLFIKNYAMVVDAINKMRYSVKNK